MRTLLFLAVVLCVPLTANAGPSCDQMENATQEIIGNGALTGPEKQDAVMRLFGRPSQRCDKGRNLFLCYSCPDTDGKSIRLRIMLDDQGVPSDTLIAPDCKCE
jgi:hypothetical protein